jgi:hypothetical protein
MIFQWDFCTVLKLLCLSDPYQTSDLTREVALVGTEATVLSVLKIFRLPPPASTPTADLDNDAVQSPPPLNLPRMWTLGAPPLRRTWTRHGRLARAFDRRAGSDRGPGWPCGHRPHGRTRASKGRSHGSPGRRTRMKPRKLRTLNGTPTMMRTHE